MSRKDAIPSPAPSLVRLLRRLWPTMRKYRLLLGGAFVAMFLEVGFRVLAPWPLKFVFDRIVQTPASAEPSSSIGKTIGSMDSTVLLTVCAVGLVMIAAGQAFATYLRRVGFALVGDRVLTQCRSDMFAHLQSLSISSLDKIRTGDLLTRITGDIGRLQEVVSTAAMPLIAHFFTVIALVIAMLFMRWELSLVVLALMPVFWLSTMRIGREIRSTARRQRSRHGDMGSVAQEAIASARTVKSLSVEDMHGKAFAKQNERSLKEGVRGKRLSARLLGTAEVLIAVGTASVLWYGARLVMLGEMTAGDLIVFLAYVRMACRPIRNMAKYTARLAKASASAERIAEIFETAPTIVDRPDAVEAPVRVASVSLDKVTFGYDADRPVLAEIELHANTGEIIALVGKSGAGKSTLASLLLRLHDPDAGSIRINDADIRSFTIASLRSRISVVPQDTALFAATVRENIGCTVPGASDEQIVAAAKLACADEFITALPEGYDTVVGERGATLSLGQRQRIALARAAVRDAPILVFDEPTASLDSENSAMLCRAIRNLGKGRISFIISHDLATVMEADQIVVLDDGKIVERGTHEQLLALGGEYSRLYALQTQRHTVVEIVDVE